jgi:hypothetical protein
MTSPLTVGQRARLRLSTDGVWSASDLGAFLLAVEGMYSVLGLYMWTADPDVGAELPWRIVQLAIQAKLSQDATTVAGPRATHDDLAEAAHISDWIGMPHAGWGLSHLRVATLELRSPGLVVFEGLDRVVHEMRTLIRDLLDRDTPEQRLSSLTGELRDIEIEVARAAVLRAGGQLEEPNGHALPRSVRLLAAWSQRISVLAEERRLPRLRAELDSVESALVQETPVEQVVPAA